MNSEQGLEALIRPSSGQVCQRFAASSNWSPGSPQACAVSAMRSRRSPAFTVRIVSLLLRPTSGHGRLSSAQVMKASVTRTEWLAFWKNTEE